MDLIVRFRRGVLKAALCAVTLQLLAAASGGSAIAAPEPTAQAAKTSPGEGYDISYPQCSSRFPKQPAFGIVGVNGGLAYATNACLAAEYQWAKASTSPTQPHVSFYLNTGNPGPQASTHWPAAGTSAPRRCEGTWSQDCAYDYGWNAALDSFNKAVAASNQSAAAAAPWWLDVETANSWSTTDLATNRADLQGAIDVLKSVSVRQIGIYSTAAMWGQITGANSVSSPFNAAFVGLPNWVPGARTLKEAPTYCSRTITGGTVTLVQYASGGFDADYVCPGR